MKENMDVRRRQKRFEKVLLIPNSFDFISVAHEYAIRA